MKIKVKDHPRLAAAHTLVTNHPEMIIAGGVARDILLGVEYNDVDIFAVTDDNARDIAKQTLVIKQACDDLELDLTLVPTNSYEGIRFNAGNLDICLPPPVGGVLTTEMLVGSFDMVMSQAWLEPTKYGFKVKATDLFHQLNNHKILGYYSDSIHMRSKHVLRIQDKYPDYLLLELAQERPKSTIMKIDNGLPF